jgi:hypothetical protein
VFENKCVLACDSATRRPDKKQACGPLNLVGIKCTALAVAEIMLEGKGRQLADSAPIGWHFASHTHSPANPRHKCESSNVCVGREMHTLNVKREVVSSPTTRGASATTSSAHVAAAAWLASLAILAGQHGVLEHLALPTVKSSQVKSSQSKTMF